MKTIKLSAIKPNENNPRYITEEKFEKLVNSIIMFPKMMQLRPMVIKDKTLLGGNMRRKAIAEIANRIEADNLTKKQKESILENAAVFDLVKVGEIPADWVANADDLTEEQQQEFIVKDNVGFGSWDWDALANEWDAGELAEWGLDLPGVEEEAELLEAAEDDYEEPEQMQIDVVEGDLIEIGEHRLLCGDSTNSDDVARLMNGEKADLLLTDLPYGVSYTEKNKHLNSLDGGNRNENDIINDNSKPDELYDFAKEIYLSLYPFLSNISSYYAFMPQGGEQMMMMMALKDSGFLVKHELIWCKNNHVLGRCDYNYKHEPICFGWKKKGTHKFYGGFNTSVLDFDKPNSSKMHPTMKPLKLISKLISNSTKDDQLIIDPTIGSGSTMVAAHQINRRCFGLELSPKYCQVIIDRMHKLDPNLEIKINGEAYEPKTDVAF